MDEPPAGSWVALGVLCLVQFGASTDNAALTNAISAIVVAFHTTVADLQVANAMYPLVSGATMVAFGLLGVIIGWKTLLQVGLVLLVAGEAAAVLSPNVTVFNFVARVLTGLGASMAIPAVLALVVVLHDSRRRALAFGAIGATNGVASAIGPVGSGLVIVSAGWRWVFAILAVLFAAALLGSAGVHAPHRRDRAVTFDGLGALLIGAGLTAMIFGLLELSTWGTVRPIRAPFEVLGFSPAPFLIAASLPLFWLFLIWERRREAAGRSVLLPRAVRESAPVRAGLAMNAFVFVVVSGSGFVITTFLQIVVGYNAVQTGLVFTLFAVGMAGFAIGTPAVAKTASPRLVCQLGVGLAVLGFLGVALGLQYSTTNALFYVGLFLAGVGNGLVASQASVAVARAIPARDAAQSGGLQGTARNIGAAVSIAIGGVVLIFGLSGIAKQDVARDPALSSKVKNAVEVTRQLPFSSDKQVRGYLAGQGLPAGEAGRLVEINGKARLAAARTAVLALGAILLLFLFPILGLPTTVDDEFAASERGGQHVRRTNAGK